MILIFIIVLTSFVLRFLLIDIYEFFSYMWNENKNLTVIILLILFFLIFYFFYNLFFFIQITYVYLFYEFN